MPRPARRTWSSWAVLLVVLVVAAYLVVTDHDDLTRAARAIGPLSLLLSGVFALLGTVAIMMVWRSVLTGLGVEVDLPTGAATFFVTQLGKYIPGLVWPAVAQMEAGRRWGGSRRTMLSANLLLLVVLATSGLALGMLLLPWSVGVPSGWWWWIAGASVPLLLCIHPRVVPAIVDRVVVFVGREPLDARVATRSWITAFGWAGAVWLLLGAHLWMLLQASGAEGRLAVPGALGAMGLAWTLGLVVVLAPAGVGVREAILVAVCAPLVGRGPALADALASRVLLTLADVVLAGAGAVIGLRRPAAVPLGAVDQE